MTAPTSSDTNHELQLNEILLTYVEAAERGQAPDRRQFLAAHPQFAAELAEFWADQDRLERLAAPLRGVHRTSRFPTSLSGVSTPVPADLSSSPTAQTPAGADCPDGPVGKVGQLADFRLVRQVGQGGMGTVYEAYQLSLRRPVAVKVLPQAAALDPRQLQRFYNESQAAAHLHHPNIVPVYAVDCAQGVHFYAMQFIEGQSLAALINHLRRLRPAGGAKAARRHPGTTLAAAPDGKRRRANDTTGTVPSPGQPLPADGAAVPSQAQTIAAERSTQRGHYFRRVARLALTAAEALEHAHQLGVVHRDIKPANLLLDRNNDLWITDFGLALLHNNAGLTTTGELVGTLRYMSPEQAAGKRALVDHRTDIYSLGVTLYELLTLEPVFASPDGTHLLHQIAFDEPRTPRSLDRTIPFELETIVLKALAKNPAERYATAQDLADDLKRFLEDQPVRAQRPSRIDRIRKWSRRHKPVVVCALVLLLAIPAGLLTSLIMIAEAHSKTTDALKRERERAAEVKRQQLRAKANLVQAQRQRLRAEANLVQAQRAIDFLTKVSMEELVDEPDVLEVRRKLLEGALQYYQEFIEQQADNASLQKKLAFGRARVAQILGDLSAQHNYQRFTSLLWVLMEKDLQLDLHMSAAQGQKIATLSARLARERRDALHAIRKLPEQERGQKFRELAAGDKIAIAEILTPGQASRLKQIALQQLGCETFSEAEVVKALALDKNQKKRIGVILNQARRAVAAQANPSLAELFGPSKRDKNAPNTLQILKHKQEEILARLTPAQQAAWKAMTGEPFRGRIYPGVQTPFGFSRGSSRKGDSNLLDGLRLALEVARGQRSEIEGAFGARGQGGKKVRAEGAAGQG